MEVGALARVLDEGLAAALRRAEAEVNEPGWHYTWVPSNWEPTVTAFLFGDCMQLDLIDELPTLVCI